MTRVPTLHIRNVPEETYVALRARAEREGRSLNGVVARILSESVERERAGREMMRRLDEFHREFVLSEGDPKPEDLIREARDERSRRL